MTDTETKQRLVVEVSKDKLQAWIRVADPEDWLPFAVDEIVATLKEAKVALNEHVRKQIDEFIAITSKDEQRPERLLIATGRPAVECKDGTFHRSEEFKRQEQDWQGDAVVNYYTYNSIHMVEKDDPIGTVVAAVPCVAGIDVFGEAITTARRPKEVEIHSSVRRSDDDPTIAIANAAGQIDYNGGVLSINEVFRVPKDVNFGTGNIDCPIDVQVPGTVHDGFAVKSQRGITIGGAIESAEIEAQSDIVVRGGILQKGGSSVKSGGDIVARFCDEADLRATGDVKICKELMNSHVHCEGKLLAVHGVVIGGWVYAREGVEVATLGSGACVTTEIIIGVHPDVIDEAERIRESLTPQKEAAQRLRSAVQPLMANLKRLTPAQKEKATELMFEADAMDAGVAEAESKCVTMVQEARAKGIPYVLVSKEVHQGVTVRIGRRITTFHKSMLGPIKIEKRKVENVTEFVAVNQLTGSISILPSSNVVGQEQGKTGEPKDSG